MTTNSTRLELKRADFFPKLWAQDTLQLEQLGPTSFRFAAFLYSNIADGVLVSRQGWTDSQWTAHLANPASQFYAVYSLMEPIGCFEIEKERRLMKTGADRAKITGFGLLPEFEGEGFGSSLLTRAVEKAFSMGVVSILLDQWPEVDSAMQLACRSAGFRGI